MSNLLPSNVPRVWNPRMPGGMRDGLDAALLGEHSGSDYAHDSSGHDRNGRYDRSANYGWMWSDFLGRWTHGFDAAQNDLITLGEPTFWLANENQFSLSLWGRRPSSLYAGLIARDGNERKAPDREWFLAGYTSQRLYLRLYQTNGTLRDIYTANDAWPLNEWMHICVTVDGPNSAVSLYRNGVYQDFTPASWDGTVRNNNRSDQWIGRTFTTNYDFTGQLADVLLHGRVVTPPEIQWLANPANHLRVPWRRKSWLVGAAAIPTATIGVININKGLTYRYNTTPILGALASRRA